jgi:acyl carrier protein
MSSSPYAPRRGAMANNVEEKLRRIVAEQMGIMEDDFALDSTMVEDIGLDSLDEVEIVMAAEEEFEMEFPDGEFDGNADTTFGDVVAFVTKKLKEEAAA